MLALLVFALILLAGLFFVFREGADVTPFILPSPGEAGYLVAAGLLTLYAVWMFAAYRGRLMQALLYLTIWSGLGLILVAGYAYREELSSVASRVAGEILPPGQTVSADPAQPGRAAVRIRKRRDGHFVARAAVNGARFSLMIDTGASSVVLRPADAERAGIDVASLSFTVPVQTANGMTFAAPVRLAAIAVGPIVVRNVDALVARPGSLNESLLGLTFLSRLRSYEFSGDYLTLRS